MFSLLNSVPELLPVFNISRTPIDLYIAVEIEVPSYFGMFGDVDKFEVLEP